MTLPHSRHELPWRAGRLLNRVCFLKFFNNKGAFRGNGIAAQSGPSTIDQYRRAAGYVDRILRGEKPADLSVQLPIKVRTLPQSEDREDARTDRPELALALADEVIE